MKKDIFKLTHREVGFDRTESKLSSLCVHEKVQVGRMPYERSIKGVMVYFLAAYNLLKDLFDTKILFIDRDPDGGTSGDEAYQLIKAHHEYRHIK